MLTLARDHSKDWLITHLEVSSNAHWYTGRVAKILVFMVILI